MNNNKFGVSHCLRLNKENENLIKKIKKIGSICKKTWIWEKNVGGA